MSKYKVGDKFIIEIEEIYNGDLCKQSDHMHLYRVKGFNSLVLDEYGLDKLQKHDALQERFELIDELKQAEYNKGMADAWELAEKIWNEMGIHKRDDVFGFEYAIDVMKHLTPQEALAKLKAYEERIEVGDVIQLENGHLMCVTITDQGHMCGIDEIGRVYIDCDIKEHKKTGKHIDIKSILDSIGD